MVLPILVDIRLSGIPNTCFLVFFWEAPDSINLWPSWGQELCHAHFGIGSLVTWSALFQTKLHLHAGDKSSGSLHKGLSFKAFKSSSQSLSPHPYAPTTEFIYSPGLRASAHLWLLRELRVNRLLPSHQKGPGGSPCSGKGHTSRASSVWWRWARRELARGSWP